MLKRLTPDERRAVRLVMQGVALARIIELYGVAMRAAWRRGACGCATGSPTWHAGEPPFGRDNHSGRFRGRDGAVGD